jgi:DNA-binding NtrC family response regulator
MHGRKKPKDEVLPPVMRSAAMRRIGRMLRMVATKQITLTFMGESGTGKEVLARWVHDLSERRRGPFLPINCAAIPEALLESELFGHERGAFTGATERARGKVEAAEGGTLFLDEIGDMPLSMQVKLLRFLEHRRFMRVGGSAKLQADVRLVFATLRPLQKEVEAGRFRADLYYRIQGMEVQVPPLRERRADITPLLAQFTAQFSAWHGMPPPRFSRAAKTALLAYDWPGNVRELRNVVETLCLLRAGKQIRLRDLPEPLQLPARVDDPAPGTTLAIDLREPLEAIVERVIHAVLTLQRGDRGRAAEQLGISVRTIQRHLAREAHEALR